jgi:hypothetical protein
LWLTQPGAGLAAKRKLAAIRANIRQLKQSPCRWPVDHRSSVREMPCSGGYRVLYEVVPDTGSNQTAGDVRVLRVYGPRQDRSTFDPSNPA